MPTIRLNEITTKPSPIAIPCWKMMPALVAGNTVVFKPSSDTPHCATLLVELMAEAGFPPGTVNLVTGSGPTQVDWLGAERMIVNSRAKIDFGDDERDE